MREICEGKSGGRKSIERGAKRKHWVFTVVGKNITYAKIGYRFSSPQVSHMGPRGKTKSRQHDLNCKEILLLFYIVYDMILVTNSCDTQEVY